MESKQKNMILIILYLLVALTTVSFGPGILLTPFLLAFLIFPAMIFYEYRLKHMKTKLLQKIEKGNIRTIGSIKEIL